MAKIVAEVRKVRLRWTEPFGECDALDHVHVGRVSSPAGRPQNQGLNAFQKLKPIRVDGLTVAQVRGDRTSILTEQKAEHVGFAMLHLDRMDFRVAQCKGTLNKMRFREDIPGKSSCTVEGVGKAFFQALHGFSGSVDGYRTTVRRPEPPKIIETHDMIRMRMRIEDRIESLYLFAEGLNSELGSGVHDPGPVGSLYIDRGAQALITWILGSADFARTTNHGYTHGRPGTQKCDR